MKNIVINILWMIIGIGLTVLSIFEKTDSFWSGVGASFLVVGVVNLLRMYRINKNDAYKEKIELELNDERNRFLKSKAWAWAGYVFCIIAAVMSFVFKFLHLDTLSIASGGAVLLVICLYFGSCYMLGKKY